jgi:hypothetical protein
MECGLVCGQAISHMDVQVLVSSKNSAEEKHFDDDDDNLI